MENAIARLAGAPSYISKVLWCDMSSRVQFQKGVGGMSDATIYIQLYIYIYIYIYNHDVEDSSNIEKFP